MLALLPVAAMADEVKVVYGTFTTTAGKTVEARLYDDGATTFPMANTAAHTITINGTVYSLDDIESLRFDVRTEEVTAINDIEANDNENDGNVYTLGGTMVRKGNATLEGLPKGVYILNKKKIVVK